MHIHLAPWYRAPQCVPRAVAWSDLQFPWQQQKEEGFGCACITAVVLEPGKGAFWHREVVGQRQSGKKTESLSKVFKST